MLVIFFNRVKEYSFSLYLYLTFKYICLLTTSMDIILFIYSLNLSIIPSQTFTECVFFVRLCAEYIKLNKMVPTLQEFTVEHKDITVSNVQWFTKINSTMLTETRSKGAQRKPWLLPPGKEREVLKKINIKPSFERHVSSRGTH